MPFDIPEKTRYKSDGTPRRVGFEVEFSGLTFDQCLATVADHLGDQVSRTSQIEATVRNDRLGEFKLELDWQFLKDRARENAEKHELIKLVADVASSVVPVELICPPIEFDDIGALDDVVGALRLMGARGTDDSFFYAFGLHINADIPDLEAGTICRYLKAYCVLQEYLVTAHAIDTSRRLSPYVNLFKDPYIREVMGYEAPAIHRIISDYLAHNPTRNRALDMLPIFAAIDGELIDRTLADPRIKARFAFHYRMPNCHIERP